jgi:hypothetical protein
MAKISPWYSIRQRDAAVYHDNDECPEANLIDPKYRKSGRRCRAQCPTCAKLAATVTISEWHG